MKFPVPIVSVVGRGGSGRTTLLEGLIAELSGRGFQVATAKHHAHETDVDVPGKDTWRHARAGAVITMVSAPNRLGSFRAVHRERTLDELSDLARDADILLTEGFGRVSPTRIEVVRAERSTQPLYAPLDLFALVTDVGSLKRSCSPVFALDDYSGLADLIEDEFLRPHGKQGRTSSVYLDHAATSWPKPPRVMEAVSRSMADLGGNPGRGAHSVAIVASRRIAQARRACAGYLGASQPQDLLFQPGCTAACNLMLKGLLEPGDRVVVGSMEHNAVAMPLAQLASMGVEVVVVNADGTGLVDPGDMEKEVRASPTRAVICQHASNVTGTIQMIGEMAEIAHENDAVLLVDGAQAAGHVDVDLEALGVDAYAASGHKGLLGPQGVGLLYLSPDLELREQIIGGTGAGDGSLQMPRNRPDRYEAGTINSPGVMALGAAAELLSEHGAEMMGHTRELTRLLQRGVMDLGFEVLGPGPDVPRVPLVSMTHRHMDADRLASILDRDYGIAARAGLHCAPWAHETVGTLEGGALRVSVGWRTKKGEIERFFSALETILQKEG